MISILFIFLQLKELEQENEDIRLRNLRRVRTEEKLHASSENCQENGDENSNAEKVGYQSIVHGYNFFSWLDLVVVLYAHTDKISLFTGTLIIFLLKHTLFDKFQILKFRVRARLNNIVGSVCRHHFVQEAVYAGLNFQEKTLGPAGP